jgi:hypothetical protein
VWTGRFPALFDAQSRVDLVLVGLAGAFIWAAWRRSESHDAVDPAALLLTLLSLVFGVQALVGLFRLGSRIRLGIAKKRYRLFVDAERLVLEQPDRRVEVRRDDIVAIRERGHWGKRSAGRRHSPVFVVTRPSAGRTHLTLPPVFGDPGVLTEALMRWRGPVVDEEDTRTTGSSPSSPARLSSRIYDEAAEGRAPDGAIAVRHGRGWLLRGPYLTGLMGFALIIRWARFDASTKDLIGPEVLGLIVTGALLVPLVWIAMSARELRARKGLAFVLTPDALLIRTRTGVLATSVQSLETPTVEDSRGWSAILGLHTDHTLVIARKDDPPIRYQEAFLGVPVEVAAALITSRKSVAISPLTPVSTTDAEGRD